MTLFATVALTAGLVTAVQPAEPSAAPPVHITLDAPATPRPISPYIYGVNQNPGGDIARFTLVRQGGNRMTAWNWENNASNAGNDWQHQSDGFLGGGDTPGEVVRSFVAGAVERGQAAVVTVPMAGYVAADKLAGGDVNQTPNFLQTRFHPAFPSKAKAGGGEFTFPPDLTDHAVYMDEMVWWLERTFADRKTPIFYALCNEPDLWDSTHARLRTQKLTYSELIERTIAWSSGIKAVTPQSKVIGFVSYGYGGFSTLQGAPDGGGRFFLDVFLQELSQAEAAAGQRLVDVVSVHWYPETRGGSGNGWRIAHGEYPPPDQRHAVALARVQAPRHLYDPTFREVSWIDRDAVRGPINLLPTLLGKIERFYPGTGLAITEYNYGGGNDISGAIAQADFLGAIGRHGLFAASWWSLGRNNAFISAGFDAFLSYDGAGARFGESSVDTASSDLSKVSAWAADRADGTTTLLLICRSEEPVSVNLAGSRGEGRTVVRAFRLTGKTPEWKPVDAVSAATSLPPMSLTVVEMR